MEQSKGIFVLMVAVFFCNTLQAQNTDTDSLKVKVQVESTDSIPELQKIQLLYPDLYNIQYDCAQSKAPLRMPFFCRVEKKMSEAIRYKVKLGVEPEIP